MKATQYIKNGVLHVICPKCGHVSLSTFSELFTFTCPACGEGSQVKPLEKGRQGSARLSHRYFLPPHFAAFFFAAQYALATQGCTPRHFVAAQQFVDFADQGFRQEWLMQQGRAWPHHAAVEQGVVGIAGHI